jgi:hypothetical protein
LAAVGFVARVSGAGEQRDDDERKAKNGTSQVGAPSQRDARGSNESRSRAAILAESDDESDFGAGIAVAGTSHLRDGAHDLDHARFVVGVLGEVERRASRRHS